MKYQNIFILKAIALLLIKSCLLCESAVNRRYNHRRFREFTPNSYNVPSSDSYNGGITKTVVDYLFTNDSQIQTNNCGKHQLSHLIQWGKFNDLFLGKFSQHFDAKVNYSPWFAMLPRQTGMLHAFERSKWYQKLAFYCVDWSPDSYSFNGALCNGIKYFGINFFKGLISFSDLITCAIIAYVTGDSLFCLTWYLSRFFLNDYLPDSLKEQYYYANGRLRQEN